MTIGIYWWIIIEFFHNKEYIYIYIYIYVVEEIVLDIDI